MDTRELSCTHNSTNLYCNSFRSFNIPNCTRGSNITMKKGQFWAMSFTGKMILAIVFLAAALLMVRQLGDVLTTGYDKQLCKTTVLANSKLRDPTAQIQQVDIKCPTRFTTIGLDEITTESGDNSISKDIRCKGGLLNKGTSDDRESKECLLNTINEEVAGMIFDCWDQFGAGQLRVFSNYDLNRQCLVCGRVEFKEEVQNLFALQDLPISLSEFKTSKTDLTLDNYMRTHNPALHKISYYEYTLDSTDIYKYPYYDYSFDKPYAVVFVAKNENAIKQALVEGWETFKSWWDETNSEEEYFANTLEFVPYDEVIEKCDSLN